MIDLDAIRKSVGPGTVQIIDVENIQLRVEQIIALLAEVSRLKALLDAAGGGPGKYAMPGMDPANK